MGTVHPERGVDLVPVVYAVGEDRTIFVPVDTVKAKATTELQRLKNVAADARCTLLVDEYDDDWSRLWWVRINGEGRQVKLNEMKAFLPALGDRYPTYRDPGSVHGGIVMTASSITGWAAG